jgi:hypothetical protein
MNILINTISPAFTGSFFYPLTRKLKSGKLSKVALLTVILSFLFVGNNFATPYYQRQSGNWNNPDTWTTSSAWTATVNTGTYPQAGDDVYLYNNGNSATITLTTDAACTNLYFSNSGQGIIAMGNFNLIVSNSWTTDWGNSAAITQGSGYLQINGGIGTFNIAKTIANFRVGSSSFVFTGSASLTVTTNYDHNCYTATVPAGINAGSAAKLHATPCSPLLSATSLTSFGNVCTGSTIGPNTFTISGLALSVANVTVGKLNGFSYSTTSGGIYTDSLTLSQGGGNYSQIIYVKFTPTTAISYDGNIVIRGGGAPNTSVATVGSGAGTVIPTVAFPTVTNIGTTTATLGGTITVDGCSSQSLTERGIYYSTTNGFADGTGTKVSETGTFGTGAFTINVTGLSPTTTYYYKAFATNSMGTGYTSQGVFNNTPVQYYSRQNGNWTSPSTWSTNACEGSINTGTYPGPVDNIKICRSHIITVNTTGLSCNSIDMSEDATQLILNNDFTINGTLTLAKQSFVSADANNLTINGDFAFVGGNSYISWTDGNLTFGGNVSYTYSNWGKVGLNCTGTGWLILSGSKKFTTSSDVTVLNFRQPSTGFTKAGSSKLTISNVFDRNCGPAPTVTAGTFTVSGTTINSTCYPNKYFRSVASGNWSSTSTWQQSNDAGVNWIAATSTPIITDGLVTIQSGNTVTLNANAGVSSLIINGSLDLSTYTLTGSSTLTVASGGILLVGEAGNFPTGFTTTTLSSGSTVNYNKAGDQTVLSKTYSNLTLSGSGVKNTTGVTVTGILSLEGTATSTSSIVTNVASTTLNYKGTTAQSITDNLFSGNKSYNLIVDNASGVNLNTDFTLNNNLTINSGKQLIIQPGNSLIVNGTITNSAGSSGLVIKASSTLPNGSLIFHNDQAAGHEVYGTVEMYSKAFYDATGTTGSRYKWQFFGIPLRSMVASPTFDGSYVREMHEDNLPAHWFQLSNDSPLTSFTGYEITQDAPKIITFQGILENRDYASGKLSYTTAATYKGQHLIGNPYTAAIDISKIVFGSTNKAVIDNTVYFYNTGSKDDWTNAGAVSLTESVTPGQYVSVPINHAGSGMGLPSQIPSMQAFLVMAASDNAAATVSIPYSAIANTVVKNTALQRSKATEGDSIKDTKVWTRIDVNGTNYSDRMWIFSDSIFTPYYDNGWDGYKFLGSVLAPQIYSMGADGDYQVNSVNEMNNTILGFKPGQDSNYTLTFTNHNLGLQYGGIYLWDLQENTITNIALTGGSYSFTASSDSPVKRFKIITRHNTTTDSFDNMKEDNSQLIVFSSEHTVFVHNLSNKDGECVIYDITGHYLMKVPFAGTSVTAVTGSLKPGVYIATAIAGTEKQTKRLIVR